MHEPEVAEIEIKPWSKVVVHEVLQSEFESMAKRRAIGQPPESYAPPLSWVNGIVFTNTSFPISTPVAKEMLEGRLHWVAVEFALCPEYKPAIRVEELKVTVPIVNVSHNKIFVKLANRLKEIIKGNEGEIAGNNKVEESKVE